MSDLAELSEDEQQKPLLTSEYIALRLIESKARGRTTLYIALIFATCQTLMAVGVFLTAIFTIRTYSQELDNQKQIARLSIVRQDLIAKNETKVCVALRDAIVRQRQVITVLAEDASFLKVSPFRALAVKALSDSINSGILPACDGFPSSPIPQM